MKIILGLFLMKVTRSERYAKLNERANEEK